MLADLGAGASAAPLAPALAAQVGKLGAEIPVGTVVSRNLRFGTCAGLGTMDRMATVSVNLSSPLGDRRVIRESDSAELSTA